MVLQTNVVTSEIHLRAAFMAAYTIFHEVGHVVWLQDFRAWHAENVEPWVGDDAVSYSHSEQFRVVLPSLYLWYIKKC